MPRSLLYLMLLQFRGASRRIIRGAATPPRAVLLLVVLVAIGLWTLRIFFPPRGLPPVDPQRIRLAAPFALLGVCLLTLITSAGDRAISFTPGEVDLLFPGPYSRRQLIGYKLFKSTLAAAASALVISIPLMRQARWWPACYAGTLLSLLFIQFFSIDSVLIVQTFGEAARGWARTLVLGLVLLLVFVVGRQSTPRTGSFRLLPWMQQVDASPVAHAVLSPFAVFGRLITAATASELARELFPAVLIVGGLFGLIFLLDANYLEAATSASARRSAHLQRIRSGAMLSFGVRETARWRLPLFPRWYGVGPILWRQCSSAARSGRGILFLLLILGIGGAPVLAMRRDASQFGAAVIGVTLWMTLLMSTMLKFDFRGDLDLMDFLKSLPIHANAIALGQLLVPALIMSGIHFLLIALLARGAADRTPFLVAAALVVPLNLLLFAIENLIFLLFPTRPAVASAGDFSIFGRQFIVLAARLIGLCLLAMPPLTVGVLCYLITRSLPTFATVSAVLLLAEFAIAIPVLAWAFNRFDPSLHTPA